MTDTLLVVDPKDDGYDVWFEPAPVTAAANEDHAASAMIAWRPSADEAAVLHLEGGEDVDQLHCTILFLGKAADINREDVMDITNAIANRFSPFTARVQGTAVFNTPDGDVLVRLVDAPELEQLQQRLHDEICREETIPDNHGFTAHITVKYLEPDEDVNPAWFKQPPFEVTVDAIETDLGEERTSFPLATEISLGDSEGHPFHGNQWTKGEGGLQPTLDEQARDIASMGGTRPSDLEKDGTAGSTVKGETGARLLRAAMAKDLPDDRPQARLYELDPADALLDMTSQQRATAKAEIVAAAGKDITAAVETDPAVKAEYAAWLTDMGYSRDSYEAGEGEREYGEGKAQAYVDTWAQSAADSEPYSLALQGVTAEVLSARSESFNDYLGSSFSREGGNVSAMNGVLESEGATMRAFVQGEYDRTQTFLADNGISEVTLYRGVSFGKDDPTSPFHEDGKYPIDMNPASSWSVDLQTAAEFADGTGETANAHILTMTVPAEDIISTARTGRGALTEGEVVVRNQPNAQAYVERANELMPMPSGFTAPGPTPGYAEAP